MSKKTIYTSYYGQVKNLVSKNIVPISISLKSPDFFRGLQLKDLAPDWSMMKLPKEEYKKKYIEKLESINIKMVLRHIDSATKDGQDCALLCFESLKTEREDDWCHRTMLAEWLRDKHNLLVHEWVNEKDLEKEKKAKQKEEQERILRESQGTLF